MYREKYGLTSYHSHPCFKRSASILKLLLAKGAKAGPLASSKANTTSKKYWINRANQRYGLRAETLYKAGLGNLVQLSLGLVGQALAIKWVVTSLLDQVMSWKLEEDRKPLVMLFGGFSGHGKSELSKLLGSLLKGEKVGVMNETMDYVLIDCGTSRTFFELIYPIVG